MAEENEVQEEAAPAKKKSSSEGLSPLVTVLLILNMFATGSIAFFQYTYLQKEANKPSLKQLLEESNSGGSSEAKEELAEKKKVDEGLVMPMKGFTVNLAQGDGPRRFVRLNAVLKFSKESKKEEFEARKPQIRDTIISILNSKRPKDLLKREGKAYLKEEIKSAVNSFLVDGQVIDLYYVGFQIN
jgi:flagellar protein FliL